MSAKQESTKVLCMDKVEKHFGGVRAIDAFSLTLHEGVVYGLIGPNGAGKTTIFNTITGIYTPSAGKIHFYEKDITSIRPFEAAQLGIGRTFQNIRLFSNMSVLDNVVMACSMDADYKMPAAIFRLPKYRKLEKQINEKAMGLLETMGLEDRANERASSLPYGHQRKLEIARAMALNPKLLLLDEPAAGMNADEEIELVEFIKGIHQRFSLTILLIEHHMDVVANLCDHVTALNFGKTIAEGTPAEVKSNQAVIDAYLGVAK
ncbi:ABC transporter ATP-binding protein [Eubacteriales bacterium OttesenSCG-928-K08]|nr:ABC transporter ATP-binding protein [Eubacteriales bacterium OttesenSCG-928-K08]